MSARVMNAVYGRYFIVGGAGFIGSHFTDRLLADPATDRVTLYDNFSSGREWHYAQHADEDRLRVVRGDVKDLPALTAAMAGHETVIHLASNPDIARAATEPDIDFREGTFLTQQVVEAMRVNRTPRLLYASGSGVYGDLGETEANEDYSPMLPVSTYGASKLAGEALIASYCAMFDLKASAFRFGNVVGPRQTHGVGFDFVRRLLADPARLRILGDGSQSKSYIHVFDVVDAVLLARACRQKPFEVFNVATGDYITVTEIAELAVEDCRHPTCPSPFRILRWRPRLEGRRPGGTPKHGSHQAPGLELQADVAAGALRFDAIASRRRAGREAVRAKAMPRRAVFLDRDGVINRAIVRDGKPYPPARLADVRILPGVREACRGIRDAGYLLILVTNQPDIARGTADLQQVSRIHDHLRRYLRLDDVKVCPHDDAAECPCRKPKPGLVLEAARDWDIHLSASYFVGDRWRDMEAAQRAGCRAIFIDYHYRERRPDPPFISVGSLREAAIRIAQAAKTEEVLCA